jgi:SAM-dependent methyltransferase
MMSNLLKNGFRRCLPLSSRMQMAIWFDRQRWLSSREYLAMGLVWDLLKESPKEFHKFVWSHHLTGYAQWYDSEELLFDVDKMQGSRKEFFGDLILVIQGLGLRTSDIMSILEVGCSLGYLLRYLETRVFTEYSEIVGIDIDAIAIKNGNNYLGKIGSDVHLIHGDMESLEQILGPRSFDLIFSAGVLSYLDEMDAKAVIAMMLCRTKKILALAGLPCLDRNNNTLDHSIVSSDHGGQWIHNFAAMISAAGGRVTKTRCSEGKFYFAFAVPA